LSLHLPRLYIVCVDIEKIGDHPAHQNVGAYVRLVPRSALGSPITQMKSHVRVLRLGTEKHVVVVVLVDKGRAERLGMGASRASLKCIRCGACI
jgi:L-lactate dehydrogenase complex protein LldF